MPAFHLSLGSSIGAREEHLARALEMLAKEGLTAERVSSVYETEPVGDAAGPGWFLNIAASGETSMDARKVVRTCLQVERALGRERTVPGGPRIIDIDLLLLGRTILHEPQCEVPHPRMQTRRFVLEPLAEIAPHARHPVSGLTAEEMLAACSDPATVRRLGPLDRTLDSAAKGARS